MPKSGRLLTLSGFLSFLVFGFIDNLKGPILPELLRGEGLTYSQGGTIFLGAYIGFMLATLLTGVMADWVGSRGVLCLAGILLVLGLLGVGVAHSYFLLVALMCIIGLGLGAIEVGANGLMLELHPDKPGRYLNLLATFHGVGSLLVPLYVAALVGAEFSWRQIYFSVTLLAIVVTGLVVLAKEPRRQETRRRSDWNGRAVLHIAFTWQMCWFYALIAAYVAAELGLAAWLVEYLQQVRGFSVARSAWYLSGFFMMLMLGRLLGSFVVDRLGYFPTIAAGLLGGGACLSLGLFVPQYAPLLSLAGLFFSIIFPTITAAVAHHHRAHMGSMMGILFTFGGLGGALGPWIVGVVSDRVGLQLGLASTVGFCMLAMSALGVLSVLASKQQRAIEGLT